MTLQYALHYHIEFDKKIGKNERKTTQSAIYDLLRPLVKDPSMRIKRRKKWSVDVKKGKYYFNIDVEDLLSLYIGLGKATNEEVRLSNEIMNKLVGMANSFPNRKVKLLKATTAIHTELDRPIVSEFLALGKLADLSSSLKVQTNPMAAAFELKGVNGGDALLMFVHGKKNDHLSLSLNETWKTVQWDTVQKDYETITNLTQSVSKVMGANLG